MKMKLIVVTKRGEVQESLFEGHLAQEATKLYANAAAADPKSIIVWVLGNLGPGWANEYQIVHEWSLESSKTFSGKTEKND